MQTKALAQAERSLRYGIPTDVSKGAQAEKTRLLFR